MHQFLSSATMKCPPLVRLSATPHQILSCTLLRVACLQASVNNRFSLWGYHAALSTWAPSPTPKKWLTDKQTSQSESTLDKRPRVRILCSCWRHQHGLQHGAAGVSTSTGMAFTTQNLGQRCLFCTNNFNQLYSLHLTQNVFIVLHATCPPVPVVPWWFSPQMASNSQPSSSTLSSLDASFACHPLFPLPPAVSSLLSFSLWFLILTWQVSTWDAFDLVLGLGCLHLDVASTWVLSCVWASLHACTNPIVQTRFKTNMSIHVWKSTFLFNATANLAETFSRGARWSFYTVSASYVCLAKNTNFWTGGCEIQLQQNWNFSQAVSSSYDQVAPIPPSNWNGIAVVSGQKHCGFFGGEHQQKWETFNAMHMCALCI